MSDIRLRRKDSAKSKSHCEVSAKKAKPDSGTNGEVGADKGSVKGVTPQDNGTEKPKSEDTNAREELTSLLRTAQPLTINIKVNAASVLLFLAALVTRMWRLEEPRAIVFDELHYGKFASLYMKKTFFFDSHPPLGKQLIAIAGYLASFDGNAQFDRIGGSYGPTVPVRALRLVPALFGSLLVPMVYHLCGSLGLAQVSSVLVALLVLLENSLLTQSRFILMESMLMCFSTLGLLSILKFREENHFRAFGLKWWLWLASAATFLSCALCVKYIGVFSILLAVYIMARDFWDMLGNKLISDAMLWLHFVCRLSVMTLILTTVYLGVFYIHLTTLTKAGPHDNIMTSAFQASLEGGLASITKGQPLEVVHGSQITLRHTHGRACWLHSHPHVYPVKYPDGRGSSHQQQVSCYSFKDVNNWWIVKRPKVKDIVVSEPPDRIRHGDVIQLIHGLTSRALNSHDVASPLSPQHQEVSCYIDYNISFPAQNLWRVDIINKDTEGDVWHTIHSHVRLIHVSSGQALKFSGKQLPDWGFHQHEVVTDRVVVQDDTVWNVEEHRYTKNADEKERERDMVSAEFVPLQPTHLSFLQKMAELQYKMLVTNQENVQDHAYSSDPAEWPLMTRGIAYWVSPNSNAQIHLIGNLPIWYGGSLMLLLYVAVFSIYIMRRRRLFHDVSDAVFEKFCLGGEVCVVGYAMHVVPYFFADRTLFLHHYLPALLFKIIIIGVVIDHLDHVVCSIAKLRWLKCVYYGAILLWLVSVVYAFAKFSVFSYGTTALSAQAVLHLKWKPSWDFIIHRP